MSFPSEDRSPADPAGDRPPTTQEIPVAAPAGSTAAGKSLPPHPDAAPPAPVPVAAPPAPVPVGAPQPTGPVDFVPGLPGLGTPPVPPPAAATTPPSPAPPATAPPFPPPVTPPDGNTPGSAVPSWPDTLESDVAVPGRTGRPARARGPLDRPALIGLGLAAVAILLVVLGVSLDFGGESLWSTVPLWSAFATLCAALGLLAFAAFYPAGNRLRSGPTWRVAAAGLVGLSVFWLLVVLPRVDTDRGFVLTAALVSLGGALWIGPRPRA